MDYEKKYKETIEAVRKLSDANPSDEGIQNWVNENFPELRESEDEWIRKTLIEYFRVGANNNETTCNIEDKEILAWLEKQGEQNSAEWSEEDERKISLLDALCDDQINGSTSHSTMYMEMHELKDWLKSLKDRVQPKQEWSEEDSMHLTNAILAAEKEWGNESCTSKWLKSLRPQKQCKPSEEQEKIRKALYIYLDWLDGRKDCAPRGEYTIKDMIAWLEKQSEQKPGDKVKPKYKIGDWIIFDENHNGVYQVEKIDNCRYYLRHYLGYTLMSVHFNNELIRHWTIQDAMDGDVLVTDDKQPFIYKGCLDPKHPDSPVAYCGIDSDGNFFVDEGNHWWTVEKVHPASEEERDQLFKKMREEGCEWDDEKKELKKIEQKIANKVEPKFNVGDTIVAKDFYECAIGTIKDIKGEQYIFTDGSGINIDEQDEWKLVKTSTDIEQKIANKIEPKFHEDDWTVSKLDRKARRISEVHFDEYNNNSYYVVDGKSVNLEEYDRLHRFWTIKDAKDGDVIVCNINKAEIGGDVEKLPNITPTICIYYNVVKDEDYIHSYCSLYDGNFLALQNTMYHNTFVYNIRPAFKEECDLLFQKMREEGCEWNSEKKEVKSLVFYRPPIKFPNFIGLGLPSGTLWADMNLGANTPTESGDYYRFGETVPFTKNSPEYVYEEIKGSIAGTDKDVVTKLLGKEYSMPTLEQIKELINECEWEWMEEDGIKGMKVTGPNGNSIFLPASGYCYSINGTFCNVGSNGGFWSSSVDDDKYSRSLYFYLDKLMYCNFNRADGFPIRAVANRRD